jgi:hypothetical protein
MTPASGQDKAASVTAEEDRQSAVVVSFDIDGTLESGDPPGPLTLALVRQAQGRGWVIGSCSDRTLREQREMWLQTGVEPDFVVVKNNLRSVSDRYPLGRFIHIGDSGVDEQCARLGGFEYVFVGDLVADGAVAGPLVRLAELAAGRPNGHDA